MEGMQETLSFLSKNEDKYMNKEVNICDEENQGDPIKLRAKASCDRCSGFMLLRLSQRGEKFGIGNQAKLAFFPVSYGQLN